MQTKQSGRLDLPGLRPRMTAGNSSAQTLDLPPGKALSMGTMKLMFCHRRMGMRCDLGQPFFCLTLECEQFMLIRGTSGRFGSRED